MPFFSVIIPTYNRAHLIGAAIESVLAQNFRDFELILVDDGSVDETEKVVEPYRDRLRFLKQANSGPGAARNNAIAHASGQYIAFLDSDDLWFPWTLEAYHEAIVLSGSPSVLYGSARHFSGVAELAAVGREATAIDSYVDYLATVRLLDQGYVRGIGTAVLRADVLRGSGGFFEQPIYCEDLDLMFRLGTASGFAFVRAPAQVALRRHQGSSIGNLDRTYRGTMYLIREEKRNAYPGGRARSRERREVICHHVRFVGASFAARGEFRRAMRLWAATFRWQLALARYKFAFGLPLTRLFPRLNPIAANRH